MEEIVDNYKKDSEYYIESNYNNYQIKQIGYFTNIIEYPIGKYYNFSYSTNINKNSNYRCNGHNTFDCNFTKIYKPNKYKLLYKQIIRQKIIDKLLVEYIINLLFI